MRDLREGSKRKAIATTVVRIGQSLHQTVVAEGVETEQQRNELRELQCDIAQGYLYSRALNASALAGWVKNRSRSEIVCLSNSLAFTVSLFSL